MLKCPKCGADIKYIALGSGGDGGAEAVNAEYTEIITDSGRVVAGHIRHKCQEKPENGGEP